MNIERDRGDVRRRFGILHAGMLACIFGVEPEADPHVCFATASMSTAPGARAEDDDPPSSKEPPSSGAPSSKEPPSSEEGAEPTGKCAHCGMQNEDDAKFCDQCGKSMAAKPLEEEEEDDEAEDEKAKANSGAHPPPKMTAPAKMSMDATTASILEASSDNPLAIKTASIKMRQERDWLRGTLFGITGKSDTREAIGAALNIPGKLAKGEKAKAKLAALRAKQDDAERWALAHRLVATGSVKRTKVFADEVDDAGSRKLDASGKPQIRIRSHYARMDLGVLRGLVTDLEGDAPKKRRDPFEPDRERAEGAAREARNGGDKAARVERMKKSPVALRMLHAPDNTRTIDEIAEALVRNEDALGVGGVA